MRLQRLATYRLIRMLRAVLPVIVVILVGIPARNYWISRINANSPEPKVVPPAADVSVQTNELSFTRKENGRIVFHLTSKEHLLFKDNRSTFREVTVVISGEKPGDFDRIISGNQGVYDKDTGDIHFTGNVNAQLDATTAAHTERLIYNNHDRVITSPVRTHVEQPGEMNGDADRLEYLIAPELLRLAGDVGMQMSNGEALHADVGEFHKKENWTAVSGDVYLEASNGWLRGATGHAELTPGTYRPTIVTIDGDVRSESRNAETSDILKTRSSNLVSVLSPGSSVQRAAIQRLFAKGDVQAEQTSKGELQTITGAEVDALLDDHGHVDTMEVRQPTAPYAKVITTTLPDSGAPNAKNEGSDRKLISQMIHIKSDGVVTNPDRSVTNATTVTTTLNSKLESGDSMTITGSAFHIVQSETRKGAASTSTVRFDTKDRAKLESVNNDSGKRISSADTTSMVFNGNTNEL
ncbi:MAG TPA: LPS export ABC transporter periplasmic protein LptC, partial [Terriglobia bacterium]|nr:LPS export ABC transporter periplasmic protein LptC [Terriglobia bacterium]